MSTLTTPAHKVDALHPAVAALVGATTFALALTAGQVLDLNADTASNPPPGAKEILAYTGLALVAAVLASWLGVRGRAGSPSRLSGTALALAIAAAMSFVAFWSGWPQILGAVAVALAVEHRRRVGSLSATTIAALGLGAVAFLASAAACVIG